ncbi:hypothetical protein MTR67_047882 [Solanum verrucosum]|uniref:Polyprotein n=1 Tax=Solanum verrucosum TaxID=315347 RepID=A0AAF0ZW04_SOLVR|nr:hypothetical protein MTR67_047882 [Solanum verrucosum]
MLQVPATEANHGPWVEPRTVGGMNRRSVHGPSMGGRRSGSFFPKSLIDRRSTRTDRRSCLHKELSEVILLEGMLNHGNKGYLMHLKCNPNERLVEVFSLIASPLTQKKVKFLWSKVWCVLMQIRKVIAYAPRQLKIYKKNYPTQDLELAAVVFALKIWRHYLYGVHVNVFTDHKRFQYVFKEKDLNLRQRSVAHVEDDKKELVRDVHRLTRLGVRLVDSSEGVFVVHNGSKSSFVSGVKAKQGLDMILVELNEVVLQKSVEPFSQGRDSVLRYQGRLCVSNVDDLREQILSEAHSSRYSIHPGSTKMYHDLREVYWWDEMKKNIAKFLAKCPNCQHVKVEH